MQLTFSTPPLKLKNRLIEFKEGIVPEPGILGTYKDEE